MDILEELRSAAETVALSSDATSYILANSNLLNRAIKEIEQLRAVNRALQASMNIQQ